MRYETNLNLECPYCLSKCQFIQDGNDYQCKKDKYFHTSYMCTSCNGKIIIRFSNRYNGGNLDHNSFLIDYSPIAFRWKPKINLDLIDNKNVKKDFIESIGCFNHGFYNASMVVARRAIYQEMIKRGLEEKYNNLYKQLENSGISENLKKFLQKVKNFGNNGAHPDFCLYDEDGIKLENEKEFAELSLNFLDKYFSDEYETELMISGAPLSKKEIETQKIMSDKKS